MSVFGHYSTYYDLFYGDKDYKSEALFLHSLIGEQLSSAKTLLELGCGTGGHAFELAELGYQITGVDLSEAMLARARERVQKCPPTVQKKLEFSHGDARSVRMPRKFDVVASLFHVMSYQNTNADLAAAFATAKAHLEPHGLFIFDCWYGPAVLTEKPTVRTKTKRSSELEVQRLAEPMMHPNRNIVDVNYTVRVLDFRTGATSTLKETHSMRYLFQPEVELQLQAAGLKLVGAGEWMTGRTPGFDTWNAYFVARA